jgi:hypothetical protein
MHLLLLLLFRRIGVNDCGPIDLRDIIHTPSTETLDIGFVSHIIFIEIPRHLLKDFILFVGYLKSYFILLFIFLGIQWLEVGYSFYLYSRKIKRTWMENIPALGYRL